VVDLRLPDVSGVDVVPELRRHGIRARVLIVTTFPTFESSFEAAAAGADRYVDGPLFGEEGTDLVDQALHGSYPVRHPSRRSEYTGARRSPPGPAIDTRIRQIIKLIDADLARPWSVGELTTKVGLSKSRLRYLFGTCTGVSVMVYIRERRLQEAARRLSSTSDDIRQIASGVGFNSGSLGDFRPAFRGRFGMSPTAHRARQWRGVAPSS